MRIRLVLGLAAVAVIVAVVAGSFMHRSSSGRHPKPRTGAARSPVPTAPAVTGDPDATGVVERPAPGLYIYHSTAARPVPTIKAEWAERITVIDDNAGVEQIITTLGTTQALQFTVGAVLELSYAQSGTSVEGEVRCTNQPPVVLLQLPFAANAVTDSVARCTDLLGQPVEVSRHTTVAGPSQQTVGASAVPVWEVVTVTRVVTPHSSSTATVTEDIAPRYGLVVRQVTQEGSDPSSIRVDRLASLEPQ